MFFGNLTIGIAALHVVGDRILVVTEEETNKKYGKFKGMTSIPFGGYRKSEVFSGLWLGDVVKKECFEETNQQVEVNKLIGIYLTKGAITFAYHVRSKEIFPFCSNDPSVSNPRLILISELLEEHYVRYAVHEIVRDFLKQEKKKSISPAFRFLF